ncbi:hypothetical protein [Amycolatopsis sp. NPDC051128]|uniref:nSTAND1 domain-containing NTPase n=1 Tax=Amycolatopsis sp. NPDC051128 TaxID=3155412 RepID=UPI0034327DCE
MPRRERPLDPDGDALSQFARGLRGLREKAGSPTYRELARRAHYAAGTLSDAAGGRKLPTLAVTLAYVQACCGDVAEWEKAWHALAAELAAETTRPDEWESVDDAPYIGLWAFRVEDAYRFFGRERVLDELDSKLTRLRFIAVFGPSGVGKSSLLRAGFVPRRADSAVVLFSPGARPFEECALQLAPLLGNAAAQIRDALTSAPDNLRLLLRQAGPDRATVVVDQFEELFTLCTDPAERTAFLDALLTASGVAEVVIGVRADFYPRCAEHRGLADAVSESQLLLGPMTATELRDAIVKPATQAGLSVEGALVTELVAEAHTEPGALPLLSHALLETWRRRRGTTLALSGYHATGGIRGALAKTAEAEYSSLGEGEQAIAQQLFLRLIELGEDTGATKRRIRRDELDRDDPRVDAVLDRLAASRLITLDAGTVELTHEALIHAWPRLSEWLSENRTGLRVHRQLTDAARAWESMGRDAGTLYRGLRLHVARDWAAGDTLLLSESEREFLRVSVAAEAAEQAAARRRTRRLKQLVALLTALLLVATTATAYAVYAQNTATSERNIAISQKVANQSDGLRGVNPALAAQLSLAAYNLASTTEARGSLLSTFAAPYATQLTSHTDGVNWVAYRPDGHVVATASDDHTARLWDVTDPHHPRELATLPTQAEVYSAGFSPAGTMLAVAGGDNATRLWDVTDPAHPLELGTLTGHTDRVYSAVFRRDGHTVATAGEDHTVRLWDVTDPRHPRLLNTLTSHTQRVYQAVFTPDGNTLATASGDNTTRLWDVTDPVHPLELGTLTGHTDRVRSVAISPDGHTVATAGYDGTTRLWAITDPRHPHQLAALTGHTGKVASAAFSPDGRTLATAGEDRALRLWDVTDPQHPAQPTVFPGHTERIWCAVFSPDGRTVTTAAWDRTVRLWDLADPSHPGPPTALSGHDGPVHSVAFSPDRRTAATASGDGTARLWDLSDAQHPRTLAALSPRDPVTPSGHTMAVMSVAFSPDGQTLATAHDDYTARLWDIADLAHPRERATLTGHTDTAYSVAFSPDGHLLAVAGADRTVLLWDVTTPSRPREITANVAHLGPVYSLAFSPDGRTLATASWDSTVALWDVAAPSRIHKVATLTGHNGPVWSVAFSPDRRTLGTAGDDRTARLWDITNLQHPQELATLTGHTGHLYAIAFSPDGQTAATASDDRTARLWSVGERSHPREIAALTGHTNRVWSVAFSPDGHTAATGSDDNIVQLRETDIARITARICATVDPVLSQADWNRYLPGLDYRPPCPR